ARGVSALLSLGLKSRGTWCSSVRPGAIPLTVIPEPSFLSRHF
ncbi:MAG: hypothetical protein ACI8PQ_002803, partial [Planctomycetota bacterium]